MTTNRADQTNNVIKAIDTLPGEPAKNVDHESNSADINQIPMSKETKVSIVQGQSKIANRFDQVLNKIEIKFNGLKQLLSPTATSTIVSSASLATGSTGSTGSNDSLTTLSSNSSLSSLSSFSGNDTQKVKPDEKNITNSDCGEPIEKARLVSALKKDNQFSANLINDPTASQSEQQTLGPQSIEKTARRVMFADGTRPGDCLDDKPHSPPTHLRKKRSSSALTKKCPLTSNLVSLNHTHTHHHNAGNLSYTLVPFFGFSAVSSKQKSNTILMHNQLVESIAIKSKSKPDLIDLPAIQSKKKKKRPTNQSMNWIDWNNYNTNNWIPYTIDDEAHLLYTSRINQAFLLGWLIKSD